MSPMRDERRTREDSATQPMDAGWLSFAKCLKSHKFLGMLFEGVLLMSLSLYESLSFLLSFFWLGHVSSSL